MKIETAIKVNKLLEQKKELENFLENIKKLKDPEKTIMHFDCFTIDGTVYPSYCTMKTNIIKNLVEKKLNETKKEIEKL